MIIFKEPKPLDENLSVPFKTFSPPILPIRCVKTFVEKSPKPLGVFGLGAKDAPAYWLFRMDAWIEGEERQVSVAWMQPESVKYPQPNEYLEALHRLMVAAKLGAK